MKENKERSYYFDNIKAILIFLVVIGHLIEVFLNFSHIDSSVLRTIYLFIYSFHMPAFVFISGYFSKSYTDFNKIKKYLVQTTLVFVVFQVFYVTLAYLFFNNQPYINLTLPSYLLWYLFCLMIWRASLPLVKKLRYPFIISIILAVSLGYLSEINILFSLNKLILFFPFFIAGYYFKENYFTFLKKNKIKILSFIVLVSFGLLLFQFRDKIKIEWFRLLEQYYLTLYGPNLWFVASIIRLFYFFLIFAISFSFFSLVPSSKIFFTSVGKKTLQIYLLHGFAVGFFLYFLSRGAFFHYLSLIFVHQTALVLFKFLVLLIGIILIPLLSLDLITNLLGPVLAPKVEWLLQKMFKDENYSSSELMKSKTNLYLVGFTVLVGVSINVAIYLYKNKNFSQIFNVYNFFMFCYWGTILTFIFFLLKKLHSKRESIKLFVKNKFHY